jgi:hypothetical protein
VTTLLYILAAALLLVAGAVGLLVLFVAALIVYVAMAGESLDEPFNRGEIETYSQAANFPDREDSRLSGRFEAEIYRSGK